MFEQLEKRRLLAADFPVLATQMQVVDLPDSPNAFVLANINGDATPDLVTTSGQALRVFLGKENVAYEESGNSELSNVGELVAANVDADEYDEILVLGSRGVTVVHLTPQGEIEKTTFVEGRSFDVRVADLNGDGNVDLVMASTNRFRVANGDGNGEFGEWIEYPFSSNLDSSPATIMLHDANQDSHMDIVAANSSAAFTYLNDGGGVFELSSTLPFPEITTVDGLPGTISIFGVADMNRDGTADLIGSASGRVIASWAGNRDGSFGARLQSQRANGGIRDIQVGDLNNDGLSDLVVSHTSILHETSSPGLSIHFGESVGGVGQAQLVSTSTPVDFQMLDVDQDGFLDLTRLGSKAIYVHDMQTPNVFDNQITDFVPLEPKTDFELDIDQDGTKERIAYNVDAEQLEVYADDTLRQTIGNQAAPEFYRSADINGDGIEDLVVFTTTSEQVQTRTFLIDANGRLKAPVISTQSTALQYFDPQLIDLNGDGIPDSIGRSGREYVIQHGRRDGTFTETQIVDPNVFASSGIAFVDLNNDGVPEIVQSTFSTTIMSRQANGDYAPLELGITGLKAFGDFNGDGIVDIASTNAGTLGIAMGNGTFRYTSRFLGGATRILSTDDINGDGFDDLIVVRDKVSIYYGGTNGLALHTSFSGWTNATNAIAEDFTDDGIVDYLTFNDQATNLFVIGSGSPAYELATLAIGGNNGTITDAIRYSIPGISFQRLNAMDINGDNMLDLVIQTRTGMTGTLLNVLPTPDVPDGDLNQDLKINALDIDFLCSRIGSDTEERLDLNDDQLLDEQDIAYLVEEVMLTAFGDIDLDGKVGFRDFLALAANFGQENSSWAQGDLDCSGSVGFSDFLLLAANFGFQRDR